LALGAFPLAAALASLVAGCGGGPWKPAPCPRCEGLAVAAPTATAAADAAPTVAQAAAFMKRVEGELRALLVKSERAGWVQTNFITSDTQEIAAEADRARMIYLARTIEQATRFDALALPPALARRFRLLKIAATLPAPSDAAKTAELAAITSALQATYGKGKYCPKQAGALRRLLAEDEAHAKALACTPGHGGVTLDVLTELMAQSRDEPALREAWLGWRLISPPMRKSFQRYVELGNEGAREIGFADVGALWRSGYDMPAEAFRAEIERLWAELAPFYRELHCYVRAALQKKYGKALVKDGAPIPAHLLGNMWAQTWNNVLPLVMPYPGAVAPDVDKALVDKKYTQQRMVRVAEGFFTSLGLDPLPQSFWERSLFVKPRDREVVCHASAWDVHFDGDLRIKMCIHLTEEDLRVVHHELGHDYYFHYYGRQPLLFQQGANDGFHEAIGDTIALSITPAYLHRIGLIGKPRPSQQADINYLMKMALDKVAFLPFGKLIDQWRWEVFAGKIAPDHYNRGWWALRTRYQGIAPPVARSEASFDPGAKYHVPANVPYIRYFLAFVYQFQFQRALCRAAGYSGPLYKCSIYGNEQAGAKLRAMLEQGASKPWQQVLASLSGETHADAGALLEYFAPLRTWLSEQIKGQICGW